MVQEWHKLCLFSFILSIQFQLYPCVYLSDISFLSVRNFPSFFLFYFIGSSIVAMLDKLTSYEPQSWGFRGICAVLRKNGLERHNKSSQKKNPIFVRCVNIMNSFGVLKDRLLPEQLHHIASRIEVRNKHGTCHLYDNSKWEEKKNWKSKIIINTS